MRIRDSWLKKRCLWFYRHGITANRMTFFGWVALWIWIVFHNALGITSLVLHIPLGILVGLTDFLDGPLARNNDNVTPEGTLGDYLRDLVYVLHMIEVGFYYGLDWFICLLIISVEILAIYLKWCAFYKFAAEKNYSFEMFLDFAEDNFQSTFYDRTQFSLLCVGMLIFVLGSSYNEWRIYVLGTGLLWASLGFSISTLYKEAMWSPPEEK